MRRGDGEKRDWETVGLCDCEKKNGKRETWRLGDYETGRKETGKRKTGRRMAKRWQGMTKKNDKGSSTAEKWVNQWEIREKAIERIHRDEIKQADTAYAILSLEDAFQDAIRRKNISPVRQKCERLFEGLYV